MKSFCRKISLFVAFTLIFTAFTACLDSSAVEALAAANTAVSSVSNTADGVKVSWTKDTAKTGYYVYRKAGSATKWSKVKTVAKNTTASWTDTNTKNGTKYTYKVCSYKGKKVYSSSKTKVIYRLTVPSVTVKRKGATSINVKTGKNSSATGYQITYATNSKFSNAKSVYVRGNTADKAITGLKKYTKYYVKVRAYKTVGSVKYYSAYSSAKSVITYVTAYTTNVYTNIYNIPDSKKGKVTTIRYMSKVYLFEITAQYSSGYYQRLKYNGKFYYAFNPKGSSKFTTKKNPYDYSNASSNKYQQDVVDKAVWIFKNWDTKYVHDQSEGVKDTDGKYGFDCSGFVSYVLNQTMTKYCKAYKVDKNITTLGNTGVILNEGYSSEFKATLVCKGKYDYSKLQPGDVLFFKNTESDPKAWDHCGIYLGNKQFIHCTKGADGVEILPIAQNFVDDFVKAIRFVPDENGFKEIDKSTNALKNFSVYSRQNANSEYKIGSVKKGDSVKLLYTVHTCGSKDYAYIYDSTQNLYCYVWFDSSRQLNSILSL